MQVPITGVGGEIASNNHRLQDNYFAPRVAQNWPQLYALSWKPYGNTKQNIISIMLLRRGLRIPSFPIFCSRAFTCLYWCSVSSDCYVWVSSSILCIGKVMEEVMVFIFHKRTLRKGLLPHSRYQLSTGASKKLNKQRHATIFSASGLQNFACVQRYS